MRINTMKLCERSGMNSIYHGCWSVGGRSDSGERVDVLKKVRLARVYALLICHEGSEDSPLVITHGRGTPHTNHGRLK